MSDSVTHPWLDGMARLPARSEGESAAEQIAHLLRTRIIEGHLQPGVRLSEEAIASSLDVSRNSLREAFRLLAHDRLLLHVKNRGVFVRELDGEAVVEIYQLRQTLELAAIRHVAGTGSADPSALREAVNAGLNYAVKGEWRNVGTANAAFHQALGGLAGNSRTNQVMNQLMAELRLAFHVMKPMEAFFAPYLPDNVRICELVEERRWNEAEEAISSYTARAQAQLLEALAAYGGKQ